MKQTSVSERLSHKWGSMDMQPSTDGATAAWGERSPQREQEDGTARHGSQPQQSPPFDLHSPTHSHTPIGELKKRYHEAQAAGALSLANDDKHTSQASPNRRRPTRPTSTRARSLGAAGVLL